MRDVAVALVLRVTVLLALLSGPGVWPVFAIPLANLSFAHSALQECVQRVAQARGWQDTEEVTSLVCSFDGIGIRESITTLDGLEALSNLERLNLPYHDITDLTPLSGLTNLTVLLLEGNVISELTPLAGLPNLSAR